LFEEVVVAVGYTICIKLGSFKSVLFGLAEVFQEKKRPNLQKAVEAKEAIC